MDAFFPFLFLLPNKNIILYFKYKESL